MAAEDVAIANDAPIGIFDSGIGGLSVLRHIRLALPHEHLIYFADSGFAPYGEKPESAIIERCLAIADFLRTRQIKLLVVACNSATAAAISALRSRYPDLPLVGVEPGLKPSSLATRSGVVGVMATAATLSSQKFGTLLHGIVAETGVRFILQPCHGLAAQIERGELYSPATVRLLHQYLEPILAEEADTIVLGCTHYPFVRPAMEDILRRRTSAPIQIIDTGEPVARQTLRRLTECGHIGQTDTPGSLAAYTTGSITALSSAFQTLLQESVEVQAV